MAEWCGHCKNLKVLNPIYDKYDNKEYNGDDIVIGALMKMNTRIWIQIQIQI